MQSPPGVLSPHPVVHTCTLWLDTCNQAVYVPSQHDVPCTNTGTPPAGRLNKMDGTSGGVQWPDTGRSTLATKKPALTMFPAGW